MLLLLLIVLSALFVGVSVLPTLARGWQRLGVLGGIAAAPPAYFWWAYWTADWDKDSALAGFFALYLTGAWLLGMAAGTFAVVGAKRGWQVARPPKPALLAGLPTAAFCLYMSITAFSSQGGT